MLSNHIDDFQGGRHVDYVADLIISEIIEIIKMKVGARSNVNVRPLQANSRSQVQLD